MFFTYTGPDDASTSPALPQQAPGSPGPLARPGPGRALRRAVAPFAPSRGAAARLRAARPDPRAGARGAAGRRQPLPAPARARGRGARPLRVERRPARACEAHLRADRRRAPAPRPLGRGAAAAGTDHFELFAALRGKEVSTCTGTDECTAGVATAAAAASPAARSNSAGWRSTSATPTRRPPPSQQ